MCPDNRSCKEIEPYIPDCPSPECSVSIPAECVIYSGPTLECPEKSLLYPDVTHKVIQGKPGTLSQRTPAAAFSNINSQLCYVFTKGYIKQMLENIKVDEDLSLKFCEVACTCGCIPVITPEVCECPAVTLVSTVQNGSTYNATFQCDLSAYNIGDTVYVSYYPIANLAFGSRVAKVPFDMNGNGTLVIPVNQGNYLFTPSVEKISDQGLLECSIGYSAVAGPTEDEYANLECSSGVINAQPPPVPNLQINFTNSIPGSDPTINNITATIVANPGGSFYVNNVTPTWTGSTPLYSGPFLGTSMTITLKQTGGSSRSCQVRLGQTNYTNIPLNSNGTPASYTLTVPNTANAEVQLNVIG